ncbi:MAG: class II fructose-bisphosphate aldolase [Gammaproteobacteria bacterium]
MRSLREVVADAQSRRIAVGHFNISDSTQLNTIAEAARELGLPVIIGVSEGERAFIGVRQVAALAKDLQAGGQEIYVNADHSHTFETAEEAIDAGFDAVIIDASKEPIDTNIALTKEVVAYAKSRGTIVEGELGYIGQSSKALDAIPEGAGLDKTSPEDAARFIAETGVDLFSPSVGNIHGMLKNMPEPALDIPRIQSISHAGKVPLVLHGASGNSEADIRAAIQAGVAIVHINTEIRVAYRKGIEEGLAADEVAPYKYLGVGAAKMKEVVIAKLKLFNRL